MLPIQIFSEWLGNVKQNKTNVQTIKERNKNRQANNNNNKKNSGYSLLGPALSTNTHLLEFSFTVTHVYS